MKVRIIKGTNQIGGCITEIESYKGTKIIIDYGENLDNEKQIIIPGLTKKDNLTPRYDGVIITHSHQDHIGCASLIKKEIPLYLNKESYEIHKTLCYFTKNYSKIIREKDNTIKYFTYENSFYIKDIKITPFIADHSSYNSTMFLIEADNQKILHTGDYRNHGNKGSLFNKILNKIGQVDLLITEGTTLGDNKRNFIKEKDLIKDFQKLSQYDEIYVMCSSTNIDRIVNLYKAFSKTHLFIMDMCMNSVTSLLKNIPNSNTFHNVYTFVSPYQKTIKEPYGRYIRHTKKVIYDLPFNQKFVLSLKESMRDYLESHEENIQNACLIYSMWDGYLNDNWQNPKLREFINYLKDKLHMDFYPLHTSGHASSEALKTLDKIVKPEKVIIIHTKKDAKSEKIAQEIFQNRLLNLNDQDVIDLKKEKKMLINNYDINNLRKRYAKSKDFIIRIRDEKKEKSPDIVYYNGIKAFFMQKQDNNITISLTDNIYKLNRSNIDNIIGKEKDKTKITDLINGIKAVRTDMQKYVGVHLSSIKLGIGSAFYKQNYQKVQEKVFHTLEKINDEIKPYGLKMDIPNIMQNLACKCCAKLKTFLAKHPELNKYSPGVNENNVYEIINKLFLNFPDLLKNADFKVKVDTGLRINNPLIETDLEIEKIFILNTIFKDNLKYDSKSGFSMPEFTYKMLDKEMCNWEADFEEKLNTFDELVKKAIEEYENKTGEELEKKYQHLFMLKKKLQYYPHLANVIPFEEEYYTEDKKEDSSKENSHDKRDRIDCIFIDPQENQSDIYLIELKVNDAVIGSPQVSKDTKDSEEHGINVHLKDINDLLNNKDKYDNFIQKLIDRYNYRDEVLQGERRIINPENILLHYWLICAVKGKDEEDEKTQGQKVLEKIAKLKEDIDIKDISCVKFLETGEDFLTAKDGQTKCDIKLLFNIWDDDKETKFYNIKEFQEYSQNKD